MKIIRKILLDAAVFFLGSALGLSLVLNVELNMAPSPEESYSMISGILYSYWSRRADLAMKADSPKIARWAVENDIALSESRLALAGMTSARPARALGAEEMTLDYSRLSLLHAVLGQEEKYRLSVRRAFEWSLRRGSSRILLSEQDVIDFAMERGGFGPQIKSLLAPRYLGEENAPPHARPLR